MPKFEVFYPGAAPEKPKGKPKAPPPPVKKREVRVMVRLGGTLIEAKKKNL